METTIKCTDPFHPSTDEIRQVLAMIGTARREADRTGRKLLLDLFCCQGAMSAGYDDAGFIVIGVDIDDQSRYPFRFVQMDAVRFAKIFAVWFDAASASPPCQDYSLTQRIVSNDFPRLIAPTRDALIESGVPFVIENVGGAKSEMNWSLELCGQDFGLRTYRHRVFEFGGWYGAPPILHRKHVHPTVKMGRALTPGDFYHAVGNFQGVDYVRRDLNLPWMNRDGLRECAPRQYAQYIGVFLMEHLTIERDDALELSVAYSQPC
jgi:DNA (cytosine-5)-methyltransferase 1